MHMNTVRSDQSGAPCVADASEHRPKRTSRQMAFAGHGWAAIERRNELMEVGSPSLTHIELSASHRHRSSPTSSGPWRLSLRALVASRLAPCATTRGPFIRPASTSFQGVGVSPTTRCLRTAVEHRMSISRFGEPLKETPRLFTLTQGADREVRRSGTPGEREAFRVA
jgi:hypothetical protein